MKPIRDINLSDIVGNKILKIEFSHKPESSYRDGELSYSVDQGVVRLTLDNGMKLSFPNSEWGSMDVRLDDFDRYNDYVDYTQEDIEDKL
jgi:hypothetical protein